MKGFLKDILSNVVATIIVSLLGILGALMLAIINPSSIPYIAIILILIIGFSIVLKINLFGIAKFQWNHTQSLEKHCMILNINREGQDIQNFDTLKTKDFKGNIDGYYDWSDVAVNKVNFSAENARIYFETKNISGKAKKTQGTNEISINGDPISANYTIQFNNSIPSTVRLDAKFNYDIEIMEPEYYFEVCRPVKKLEIELQVETGVMLHNVKKHIVAEFGDKKKEPEILIGKKLSDNPTFTTYKYTIRNLKLFHKYKIIWDWIKG